MSTITIHDWKEVEQTGSDFEFVLPEFHIRYWEVPKWWYKGKQQVYASCVRVDVDNEASIYIDGLTPLMSIQIDWDGANTLRFSNFRDIRRALILDKNNYAAVIRGESDEYSDVEFIGDQSYIVRFDNYFGPDIQEPLQAKDKPIWVNGDDFVPFYQDPIPFITGTFLGGVEPITYEYRFKEQESPPDGQWETIGDFLPQTNTPTEKSITIEPKSRAQRVHIETKATDAEGTVVYNNGPGLTVDNPVPVITENPAVSSFNQFIPGETITGFAGAFEGGAPDANPRIRWQWRASKEDSFISEDWTNNTVPGQQVVSQPIDPTAIQVRLQYQIRENSAGRSTTKTVTRNVISVES